jgi:Holliday junction resolvase-like predicted endonuclease
MIEANVEVPICTWAEEEGWQVRKLKWIGKVGAPDRLFYKDGRVVFIEFKKPQWKWKDLRSEPQKREAQRMLNAGIEYYLVGSLAEGIHVLGLKPRAAATHSPLVKRRP